MRETIGILFLLGALLLVASACRHMGFGPVPARADGPQFDHVAHLEKGVECGFCHGGDEPGANVMPTQEVCLECHEEIDPELEPEKRSSAFFDADGNGLWSHATAQDPEVIFDHEDHVASGWACVACHQNVADSTFVASDLRMNMATCIACHEREAPESLSCDSCHREIREDRPPPSHRVGWKQAHGRMARTGALDALPEDCARCHTPSTCSSCHQTEKPLSHNNLWRLGGHGVAASLDREKCMVCHKTDACTSCHEQATPLTHRGAWGSPFDRHCYSCHLPLEGFEGGQGCAVCHRGTSSHSMAPPKPPTPAHMTMDPDVCRTCHNPVPHPDNGQTCMYCHQ